MKKNILQNLAGIALSILFSANLLAQTAGTFTFSFTPVTMSPGYSGTKNVLAVWIQTSAGAFVKTKLRYAGGGTSDHLPTWSVNAGGTSGNCLATACNVTDATTGATLSSFTAKAVVWDGKNVSGTVNGTLVADGAYQITIQETWNHGTGGTVTTSFPFTKGPNPDHQTPANTANFTNIKLDWVPTSSSTLNVTTSATNVKCNGGSTGTATATPTGTPPYTYSWSTTPVQITATATGLAAGTYSVTVHDASSVSTVPVTITQPTALTTNVTKTNTGCSSATGTANVTASGGTAAYSYLWSNGKATASITGLVAGVYSITVTDANGCTATGVATIASAASPSVSVTHTNTNCGASTGTANASATGGTGSYTYLWSNGKTTSGISGLTAAVYTVTVTDAGGCSATAIANIADQGAPTGSVTATNPNCFGGADGSAIATASGGTGSLTYSWNTTPVQHTATATGLMAGSYVVTVSDAANCILNLPATITQPTAVSGNVTATAASSCSASDGSAASNISGGTSPYTYHWSNNQATSSINGLATGTYSLTVTDSKGCTFSTAGTVTCTGTNGTADAGVNSVGNPTGSMCSSSLDATVVIKNFGTTPLTSCKINYYIDNPAQTYNFNWSGSIAPGASANVNLPAVPVTVGPHTFFSSTNNPNGVSDANSANDMSWSTFNVTSTSSSIPMQEGFETSSGLPNGWTVWNPDNDAAWQVVTSVASTGVYCIGFDNCDGNGPGIDMRGTVDRFITNAYDFTTATNSAYMTFDIAYAVLNYKGQIFTDSLAILSSVDCGTTWNQFYVKGGYTLSGLTTTASCWMPSSSDWRTENVGLGNLAGQSSVMFAFENRSGWGEWIYIDNININAITGIAPVNPLSGFSIYPNPASTFFTIEGASNAELIHYTIYNLVGEEIKSGNIASNGNNFNGKVQVSDLSRGMYFVKLSDRKNTWTKKISVQ